MAVMRIACRIQIVGLIAAGGLACGARTSLDEWGPDGGDGGSAGETESTSTGPSSPDGVARALRFDGVDDVVQLPAAPGAANEPAFSVELWFKTTQRTGMFFEVFSDVPIGADRSLYARDGSVCFYVYAETVLSELCTARKLNDGAWHHAAGTVGTDGQILYIDGMAEAVAPDLVASLFTWDVGFRAGYGHIGPNGERINFEGVLDEIRLWRVQRTAEEIESNRDRSIDAESADLQAYWRLDDGGSATHAVDATNPAHDGTLVNFSFNPSPWITPGAF